MTIFPTNPVMFWFRQLNGGQEGGVKSDINDCLTPYLQVIPSM